MGVCSHFKLEHEEQRGKKMLKKKKKKIRLRLRVYMARNGMVLKEKEKKVKEI